MSPALLPAITGTKVRKFLRCRRLPFMDAHADPAEAEDVDMPWSEPGDGDEFTIGDAVAPALVRVFHPAVEARVIDPTFVRIPDAPTASAAEAATRNAMREGKQQIRNGLLGAQRWWGKPMVLVRRPIPSTFGDWSYVTIDERRYAKRHSIRSVAIPNAFFAEILAVVQGVRPTTFEMHQPFAGTARNIDLEPYRDDMLEVVENVTGSLDDTVDHGPDIRTSACGTCRWRKACARDARAAKSLTMLTGSRRGTEEHFLRHGITTTSDLATHPNRVEIVESAPYVRLHPTKTVAQANAFDTGAPSTIGETALPAPVAVEVFVDIETEGVTNFSDGTVFGILVRRAGRKPKLRVHIAASPRDRRRAWRAFLQDLARAPKGAPIFHYGLFEQYVLGGMVRTFGGSKQFLARLVDVYADASQRAVIPDRSASLKSIARALGIERRNAIDGRAAPALWYEMVRTRSAAIRRDLREYNEDDLLTLAGVTDWLRGANAAAPAMR